MNKVVTATMVAALAAVGTVRADIAALTPAVQTAKWAVDWWMPRFEATKALAATGGCEVVFIGDSITHNWEKPGAGVWRKYFAKGRYRALNVGFGGDRTEQVLWRLEHGQLDGCKAKAVCLMIGSNNTGHRDVRDEPPGDTVLGIRQVIDTLQAKLPGARIVLLPIFPRGATAEDPLRMRNAVVNREIRGFADGRKVIWLDFTDKFLTPDGRLPADLAPDFLHPRAAGYEIWANALIPVLDEIFAGKELIAARDARIDATAMAMEGRLAAQPLSRFEHSFWIDKLRMNRNFISKAGGTVDAVFLGDSITHYWDEGEGQDTSTEITDLRKTYSIINAGYGGDTTRHLLWRIQYGGELDGYKTKFVMLMIGTNNAAGCYPDETVEGIRRVIDVIQEKQPEAKIVLMAIFPRGKVPAKSHLNERDMVVNELMRLYARDYYGNDRVMWLDINDKFMRPNGELKVELFDFEYLHPIDGGYKIWREAIEPIMKETIGK